jgi:outer membrane receptor protein involved in Fe transport
MKRYSSSLLSIVLLAIFFADAPAQSATYIYGTVTDQNRAVVASALVKFLNLASGRIVSTTTDAKGDYQVRGLQPGPYRIYVSYQGFATLARSLTLRSDEPLVQDFSLSPGVIEDTVTVTVGKGSARAAAETPQTVTITDAGEIEKRRPASTLEALAKTPNLIQVGSNPAGERPRLRGLTSNRLLVLIDGERLNNVRSDPLSGISPSIIDVTEFQSLEVISGAGSSLYGSDALAGTINLVTKAPVRSETNQYLGLRFDGDLHGNGLFRRGAASVNWSIPHLALQLSGSLFREASYRAGDRAIPLAEVLRLGQFASDLGNVAGNNVALTYAVWSLPAKAEIPNGQGHGFNDRLDIWLFPSARHSLLYRQLNSQHKSLGFPLVVPPFDGRNQFNGFRRLDKYGLRYEGRELANWLPHLAFGLYRQKYSFADDNFVSTINEGSSWKLLTDPASPNVSRYALTGHPSDFTLGNFTDGKNSVTSYGMDVQASFIPHAGILITSGVGYLRDASTDKFSRLDFQPGTLQPLSTINGRASNPDSVYTNTGWFNLLEYEPKRWLRLTGSFRVDNWKTIAKVTGGFPLSTESAILDASLNKLIANPGQINVAGLKGIADLVRGTSGISTDHTILTSNVGVVLRLPGRINPYLRWGNSYREPGITERYLLRDFGDPTFSVLLASNTALKPERGRSFDVGVKIQRSRLTGSVAYFRSDFQDFLRLAFGNTLFVPPDPAHGLLPLSPFFPFHGVLYVQRTNAARVRIQGVESAYEVSVSLGRAGTLTPFGTLGWLKGSDLTPDPKALAIIQQFYNRSDTPIPLEGSARDAPLSSITPFRGIFGAHYSSPSSKWYGEYQVRYQSRVRRVDPLDISTNILTQYGTLASLNSFSTHSLRAGYTYRRERVRASLVLGLENLSDSFYFDHFQNAPARGRSLVFGITTDLFNLLRR